MRLISADSLDPLRNLAAESMLLDDVPDLGAALMLWRGAPSVVIGKNQNPWRECDLDVLASFEGVLARRISGGGAVYHDPGNLNYSWFSPRETYVEEDVFARVIEALGALGFDVKRFGSNGLAVGGRKISGTAFCLRKTGALHHGTLLLDADLERMDSVLTPSRGSFETHAVTSNPAEVVNLSELRPGITSADLEQSLVHAFEEAYGAVKERHALDELDGGDLNTRRDDMATWDWRFGKTPRFRLDLPLTIDEGTANLLIDVEQGRIERAETGGAELRDLNRLRDSLPGCRLIAEEVLDRIEPDSPFRAAMARALQPFRGA